MSFKLYKDSEWIQSVGAYCFIEKGCCCPQLHINSAQKHILEINYYEDEPIMWRLFNRAINNTCLEYSKTNIMHFKICNNDAQRFVSNGNHFMDFVKIQEYLISADF